MCALFFFKEAIFVTGGWDGTSDVTDITIYDTSQDPIDRYKTNNLKLNVARSFHNIFGVRTEAGHFAIYVFGGGTDVTEKFTLITAGSLVFFFFFFSFLFFYVA